jgi:hypothetical protein
VKAFKKAQEVRFTDKAGKSTAWLLPASCLQCLSGAGLLECLPLANLLFANG